MKKLLFVSLALMASASIFAQNTITNAGFEYWNSGKADDWNSSFSMTVAVFPITYTAGEQSTDAHSGNYAMKLSTTQIAILTENIKLPGICQLGNFNTDSIVNTIITNLGADDFQIDPTHFVTGGVPFTEIPTEVKLWAKYAPDTTNDAMQVIVLATKHNSLTGDQVIAQGFYSSTETLNEYTEISVPVEVVVPGETPDFLNIILASAGTYDCGNNELLVDDISVESIVGVTNINSLNCEILPNPSHDNLFIQLDNDREFSIVLYDLNGKEILEKNNVSGLVNLNVTNVTSGTYIVKISQDNNITAKKVVIK